MENFPEAEISREYGDRGVFAIEVDGKIIFDKNAFERPRFPDDGELTAAIKSLK